MLRILALFALLGLAACGVPNPSATGGNATELTSQATILPYRAGSAIYGPLVPEIASFAETYRNLLAAPQPAGFKIPKLAGYRCKGDTRWRELVPDSEGDATSIIGCKVGQEGQFGIFTWASQKSDGSVTQGVAISRGDHSIYDWLRRAGDPTIGEPSGPIVFGQHPHGLSAFGSPDHTDHQH